MHFTRILSIVIATLTVAASAQTSPTTTPVVRGEGDRVWIDNVPVLKWGHSGETTYCGALAAALTVVGPAHDYSTLMGDSGLAMRLRWWRATDGPGWDMSSPVGEFGPWTDPTAKSVGWTMRWETDFSDQADMSRFKPDVVASINAGRPVLTYGKTRDMALVYGYLSGGDVLLLRDYETGDRETTLPIKEVKNCFCFFDDRGQPMERRDAVLMGLRAMVRDWRAAPHADEFPRRYGRGTYHLGDDAYHTWINDLKMEQAELTPEQAKSFFTAQWWTIDVLCDARRSAAKYFLSSAPLFEGEKRRAIEDAASIASEAAEKIAGPTWGEKAVFLGPWSQKTIDDWTPEIRAREIAILHEVRELDRQVIELLEQALRE